MQSRVNHSCLIIDFWDNTFNAVEISSELKIKADNLLKQCATDRVADWEIEFRAVYNNARQLLVSKNRLGTYPSDKYKEVTIVVPIPERENVSWGVESNQFIYGIDHYDSLMKNFSALKVDFGNFKNRSDYIKDCISRAIDNCFINGIVINGTKLKLQKNTSVTS